MVWSHRHVARASSGNVRQCRRIRHRVRTAKRGADARAGCDLAACPCNGRRSRGRDLCCRDGSRCDLMLLRNAVTYRAATFATRKCLARFGANVRISSFAFSRAEHGFANGTKRLFLRDLKHLRSSSRASGVCVQIARCDASPASLVGIGLSFATYCFGV